ncbi:hypothetical protein K490DRAFT_21256, partial [Saccharata proteae CBS 121410]
MRFLSRCSAVVAIAVTLILYIGWVAPSTRQYTQIQKAWQGSVRRLVVFGDSWSDTGRYILNGPPPGFEPIRHPLSGPVWTEALCGELLCDSIDNYARSLPPKIAEYYTETVEAVLDNAVFANATSSHNFTDFALRDLQQQVRDFVKLEGFKRMAPVRPPKEWTLFTIWFGISDVFHYSKLEPEVARFGIAKSIRHLFRQLNIIAEWMEAPILVILPQVVNVTALPRFNMEALESQDPNRAQNARNLATYWNEELARTSREWTNGHIFLLDAGDMLEGAISAKQAYGSPSARKRTPPFMDVTSPCRVLKYPQNMDEDASVEQLQIEEQVCEEPDSYLFWDDFHLSGKAHRMLGEKAGQLVKARSTYNNYVAQSAMEAVRSSVP